MTQERDIALIDELRAQGFASEQGCVGCGLDLVFLIYF